MAKFCLAPSITLFLLYIAFTRTPSVQGISLNRQVRDVRRGPLCPDWDVSPCTCGGMASAITVNCDKITDIDALAKIFKSDKEKLNMRAIEVHGTSLKSLPADVFASHTIHLFFLSNNTIETVDKDAFKGSENTAEVIRLDGNKLTSFPIDHLNQLKNLRVLQLSRNQLTKIDDDAFPALENLLMLGLDNNKISSLGKNAFSRLSSVGRLDLSHNELTKLGPRSLSVNSKEAAVISLANNKIAEIDADAFSGLKVHLVDLSNNKLTILDESAFSQILKDGVEINVEGNSFDCENPKMEWLKKVPAPTKQRIAGFRCSNNKGLDDYDLH